MDIFKCVEQGQRYPLELGELGTIKIFRNYVSLSNASNAREGEFRPYGRLMLTDGTKVFSVTVYPSREIVDIANQAAFLKRDSLSHPHDISLLNIDLIPKMTTTGKMILEAAVGEKAPTIADTFEVRVKEPRNRALAFNLKSGTRIISNKTELSNELGLSGSSKSVLAFLGGVSQPFWIIEKQEEGQYTFNDETSDTLMDILSLAMQSNPSKVVGYYDNMSDEVLEGRIATLVDGTKPILQEEWEDEEDPWKEISEAYMKVLLKDVEGFLSKGAKPKLPLTPRKIGF